MKRHQILSLLSAFFAFSSLSAQEVYKNVEMADGLRSNGKIYIVVIVVLIIFLAMALYMWRMDSRLKRLENEMNS